jgi:hypothetical protein
MNIIDFIQYDAGFYCRLQGMTIFPEKQAFCYATGYSSMLKAGYTPSIPGVAPVN